MESNDFANPAARLEAVMERDTRADGRFVYAVRTTGIYCRPSCPSRRPAARNVTFHDTPEAAEAAGYRPCLRCRPRHVHRHEQVVARVQELITAAESPPTLAQLGEAVGMSPYHLQRVFRQRTGLTPRQYGQAVRTTRLEAALAGGQDVTSAQYDAGYGSSHALYREADATLGMTPGRRAAGGAGEDVAYGIFDTRLGRMLIAATGRGVCVLHLGDDDEHMIAALRAELPGASLNHDPDRVRAYAAAVQDYLDDAGRVLELPLDVTGTDFRRRVWEVLRTIPPGETRTYAELAAMIGQPQAVRAVASACAGNPVGLAIPCHRVVRTGGALGGYRWGIERKAALLAAEAGAATIT